MLKYDRARGEYSDQPDVSAAEPAQTAIPVASPAVDSRPAISPNNSNLPAPAKLASGSDMVDDILRRVASSAQQPTYVTQQALDGTRQILSNDMDAYRKAMDTHMAARPVMSPRLASEMAYANRADGNSILRQNSNAEVIMHNSRLADWEAQGKAIADKYGMTTKMQGQLSGQETGALGMETDIRNRNNATGLQAAKEWMELRALPSVIDKTKADAEYQRAHAKEAVGRAAQAQAEAEQIKTGGMTRQERAAAIKAHEAQLATAKLTEYRLKVKLAEKGTLSDDEKSVLDEAETIIEDKQRAISGLDPNYAQQRGIPTDAELASARRLKLAQTFVARATKEAKDASIFNRAARNQDDPVLIRKRLIDAGYTEDEAKQALGSKYVAPQPQQAIPAGTRTQEPAQAQPPVQGARQAKDGKWYVPDPKRPGKYLEVS